MSKEASAKVQRGHKKKEAGNEKKGKQQQHKKKKLSKFHSGTNVTAQSRAAEAPDEGPRLSICEEDPRWL